MKFKATFTLVLLLTFFLVLLGWVYSSKILVLSGYILMILLNLLNIVFAIRRRFRRQSEQSEDGSKPLNKTGDDSLSYRKNE